MVRLFAVLGPVGMPVADAGHAFLRALVDQHVRVRALPIGAGGALGVEKRWYELGAAFVEPLTKPYVNVVAAACGQYMGTRTPAATFARSDGLSDELKRLLGSMAGGPSADVDYIPPTVLAGMITVGVKNIAIAIGSPDDDELAALRAYDLVICPDGVDAKALRARADNSAKVMHVPLTPAHDVDAREIVKLLEEICGCELDISATGVRSPATPEPPATTLPPSPVFPESSSRLPSWATVSSAPSPDTSTSIGSRRRFSWSRVWRTLRSFMRSLAFWR
jgi:hypothetical protein